MNGSPWLLPSNETALAWNGGRTVWTGEGTRVILRDSLTGERQTGGWEETSAVREIKVDSSERWVAVLAGEKTLHLRKIGDNPSDITIDCNALTIDDFCFAPGGALLAIGLADGKVRLYSGETWKETQTWELSSPIERMAFSPDARWLAVACQDKSVEIRDVETGRVAGVPLILPELAKRLSWHPNNRILATMCLDGTTRLWDAATGKTIGPFLSWQVEGIAFSKDGHWFIVANKEKGVRLWRTPVATERYAEMTERANASIIRSK